MTEMPTEMPFPQFGWRMLMMLALLLPLPACQGKNDDSAAPDKASPMGTRLTLTIAGYNYTNRYIDDFSINGAGGGNLGVSDERNGGGKTTCCASHIVGANHRKVTIRWHTHSCYFRHKHREDESWELFNFYKEVEVPVKIDTAPGDPHYFEVHFYPDGHVEAAVMVEHSRPRLVLSDQREDRSDYPKCPNAEEPKE